MPIVIPAASPTGALRFEWLDPSGVLRDLTFDTSPSLCVSAATGLGAPGVELVREKLPFAPGGLVRYIKTNPVEIDLTIYAESATFTGLIGTLSDIRDWFNTGDETRRSPGYLRVTRPDDAVRQIGCFYAGGLEGDLGGGDPFWTDLLVSLLAPDPYWTDVDPTEIAYDQPSLDYTGGVPPTQAVMNGGDVDAYPVWTITGPGSAIKISNLTTGQAFELTANNGLAVLAGQTLIVDTRPASQRTTQQVVSGDGISYFDKIAPGGALWWLAPGQNSFTIEIAGMSSQTAVGLSFTPRYRGVLR